MINGYPYTDLHELNADWLLKKTAELEGKVKDLEDAPEGVTSVTPYYHNGTKIADYEQNGVAGEIYIPDNPAVLEKSAINRFDDGIDSYFKKVVSTIVPVQAGSGTPSPTNVRAISGFTECTVTDNGKNLFNKNTVTQGKFLTNTGGTVNNANGCYSDYIPIRLNTPYYYTNFIGLGSFYTLCVYDEEKNFIENINVQGSSSVNGTITFTRGSFIRINVYLANLGTCQLELGSTSTAYTPYVAPTTATISFGSAGTVYEGTVDLISGKLVVEKVEVDLGTLNWVYDTSWGSSADSRNTFRTVPNLPIKNIEGSEKSDIIADRYSTISANQLYQGGDFSVAQNASYIRIRNTAYTDAVAFKTAMSGAQVVYPLATPQEYQLTPAQLRSLVGANRLTSSTGEVTEVEYITNKTIAWLLDQIVNN